MKLLKLFCICIIVLGLFRIPVYAAVVINEILPKSEDVPHEYIELYNTGSETVSLDRWTLANTTGTVTTFVINASGRIDPHGYILFYQPQLGIIFNKNGDTIRLTDEKNTLVDSRSYASTLGYNTTMGLGPNGSQNWTICNESTPGLPNNCPVATPTTIPTPVPQITDTPIPTDTEIPIPTDIQPPQGAPIYQLPETKSILGVTVINTPTPTPLPDDLINIKIPSAIIVSKTIILQGIIVVGVWILLVLIALARRKRKIHKT
jgi:hypothetical protein